jgi:hypothetical protein
MYRLHRSGGGDKFPEIWLVLSAGLSFFSFFLLHGGVVLARHAMDILGVGMTTYQSWMLKVSWTFL